MQRLLTCVEICAGAGGQALGLALAGFTHLALVEYESDYCKILKSNRPEWNVICADVHEFDGKPYQGVDLLAGGVPQLRPRVIIVAIRMEEAWRMRRRKRTLKERLA